jgi:hypothetical protein
VISLYNSKPTQEYGGWEKREETKSFIIYVLIFGTLLYFASTFLWYIPLGFFKSLFYAGAIIVIHRYEKINGNVAGIMYFLLFLAFIAPYAHSD